MSNISRIRMIAGPNGSGKSTLIELLSEFVDLGIYVNADDIEAGFKKKPLLHFSDYSIKATYTTFSSFLKRKSTLGSEDYKSLLSASISIENNILVVSREIIDSYLASIITDFIRLQLLKVDVSFSFETVMSHKSKVDFLKTANEKNYRTYLYFVATNDPIINYERIKTRVVKGGHDVSMEKITERYKRSIELLKEGLKNSYRCYVFDNTTSLKLIAEYQQGTVRFCSEALPSWYVGINEHYKS